MAYDTPITIDEFKEAMPAHMKKNVNPDLLTKINGALMDPEILAVYRENVIGLTSVMREGRFKMDAYLNAVKFISHKLLGDNHITAWAKTFPDRYNALVKKQYDRSSIAAVCSRYAGTKLVILLMGQTMMPTHIVNAPLYQEALNNLATLMTGAKSEMVRCNAASKLVETLKPPEAQKIELDIGLKEDDTIKALRETTAMLVKQQLDMLDSGVVTVKNIAESRLINPTTNIEEGVVNG
ncbi:MAG: hypothetical protein DRH26_02000 [Deltaproteobacteria bacterium]|nr:MAG: hypothetical protein DRH26_02000 [Deltaproteobacteria bacterium]